MIGKVCKRLNHWANRTLSFAGCSILLCHVIRAMPMYHLMAMSLNADGFHVLECILRDFLWGKNELGEDRNALVAWEDTVQSKAKGGVGLDDLASLSLNLKMRLCGWLLFEDQAIWIQLSNARSLNTGFRRKTCRFWSGAKALLLDEKIHIVGSPLLRDIFRGFNKARSRLSFEPVGTVLPSHLNLEQLMLLF